MLFNPTVQSAEYTTYFYFQEKDQMDAEKPRFTRMKYKTETMSSGNHLINIVIYTFISGLASFAKSFVGKRYLSDSYNKLLLGLECNYYIHQLPISVIYFDLRMTKMPALPKL